MEVAFLDHFKDAYLPDLKTLEENGFFKRGEEDGFPLLEPLLSSLLIIYFPK